MPGSHLLRKGRVSLPGQAYLVTAATRDRAPVFAAPGAAAVVLGSLRWMDEQGKLALDAAVVMPDHVHFVAGLREEPLAAVLRSFKGFTARKVNELLGRTGTLWEPQYHDHALRREEVLTEVVLYCLNNPVRAGLAEDLRSYPHWFCRWEP